MERQTHSSELPPNITLLPHERLLNIVYHPPRIFTKAPSSLEQLSRLTRASSPSEIGKFGPSIASLTFDNPELNLKTPEHLKLYEVVFGRDSLRVATDLLPTYPELARTTTLELAKLQGVEYNDAREEEPGRIVHEARDQNDPIAIELSERLGWGWPYYGSVDATPEFVRTLAGYCKKTNDNCQFLSHEYNDKTGNTKTMADALDRALNWILRRLNTNNEGLLEFKSILPRGIENQVWKDSWDAYHHKNGELANHKQGIASIEVQVTTYDALLDAADIYTSLGLHKKSELLRAYSENLKEAIFTHFWCEEDGGYFVLGTDRDDSGTLRQLKIKTSNMGHTLNSRLLMDTSNADIRKKRDAVVKCILSPELLNVSGIRTLATSEKRFRPGSYHCGSVWLWDTHHIAKGLWQHGFKDEATDLDSRILNVVNTTHIFPEYVRGDSSMVPSINQYTINVFDEANDRINKLEQPPQEVQAWTVAAILAIKRRIDKRRSQ